MQVRGQITCTYRSENDQEHKHINSSENILIWSNSPLKHSTGSITSCSHWRIRKIADFYLWKNCLQFCKFTVKKLLDWWETDNEQFSRDKRVICSTDFTHIWMTLSARVSAHRCKRALFPKRDIVGAQIKCRVQICTLFLSCAFLIIW